MLAVLPAVAAGLVVAACTTGPSQSQSPSPRQSTTSHLGHTVLAKLHQQTKLRFVCHNCPNPEAVTVLASSRNLQPGQQGAVLAVRGVGSLTGTCSSGHPTVRFLATYRGPGGPVVTQFRAPLARPVGLDLLDLLPPAPRPVGAAQQFAFFQVVGGGEAADFVLAVWATLTPAADGCAFYTNGVLRVRGPFLLRRLG